MFVVRHPETTSCGRTVSAWGSRVCISLLEDDWYLLTSPSMQLVSWALLLRAMTETAPCFPMTILLSFLVIEASFSAGLLAPSLITNPYLLLRHHVPVSLPVIHKAMCSSSGHWRVEMVRVTTALTIGSFPCQFSMLLPAPRAWWKQVRRMRKVSVKDGRGTSQKRLGSLNHCLGRTTC